MPIRSTSHMKPQRITYNSWNVRPSNEHILKEIKRKVKKNELHLHEKEKIWPDNDSCTRAPAVGSMTAAPKGTKVGFYGKGGAGPIQPQASQTTAEVPYWVVRATSGGMSSKQRWFWKVCAANVGGPIPDTLRSCLPLLWRLENLNPCCATFPAARSDQMNVLDKLKSTTRLLI